MCAGWRGVISECVQGGRESLVSVCRVGEAPFWMDVLGGPTPFVEKQGAPPPHFE